MAQGWVDDVVLAAARRFADDCLIADGSLFTPGRSVWTSQALTDFADRFMAVDESSDDFLTKLKRQLSGLPDSSVLLAAEMLFVYLLGERDTGGGRKRELISSVLAELRDPASIPASLDGALTTGVARFGVRKSRRDLEMRFLIQLALDIKALPAEERKRVLRDPTEFEALVRGTERHGAVLEPDAVLFLMFPDQFEPVVSLAAKEQIAKAFDSLVRPDAGKSVDDRLRAVRSALEPVLGTDFHFYQPMLKSIWQAEHEQEWDALLSWAERIYGHDSFDEEERGYKLEIAELSRSALKSAEAGAADWREALKALVQAPDSPIDWRASTALFDWCEEDAESARRAVALLIEAGEWKTALLRFLERLPSSIAPGNRLALGSLLLTGREPHAFVWYRYRPWLRLRQKVGLPDASAVDLGDGEAFHIGDLAEALGVSAGAVASFAMEKGERTDGHSERTVDEGLAQAIVDHFAGVENSPQELVARYSGFLTLLDELRIRLLLRGTRLRDRLDAQGIAWWITNGEPPEDWPSADAEAFRVYQEGQVAESGERVWLVRGANNHGRNMLPEWFAANVISIGWANAAKIDPDAERESIKVELRRADPEISEGEVARGAGIIRRFLDIAPGDLVITPDGDKLFLAEVVGPTEWHEGDPRAALRHRVLWRNQSAPASREVVKTESPALHKSLRTLLTVADLSVHRTAVEALLIPASSAAKADGPATEEVDIALAALADELLFEREDVETIARLLRRKRQVVFYGPPGTGKTYVARRLAETLTNEPRNVQLVQFHASYSYEDFVEGFRPRAINGRPGFELVKGPLREIADAARQDPDSPYVLIIDELNRANVAKVFGELYFLLEYRGESVSLQYSGAGFSLPDNLWVIATMNTADRSVALLDSALRRRFYFVPFFPGRRPVGDLLRKWLSRRKPDLAWIADVVERANAELGEEHLAIGPSFFMVDDLDEPLALEIWEHAVLPTIEEHYFGQADRLADFRLERLRTLHRGLDDEEPLGDAPDVS